VVKPTTSANTIVASFRSSALSTTAAAPAAPTGAPHEPQNANPEGTAWPHDEQEATS
jgi:hypothetical protein